MARFPDELFVSTLPDPQQRRHTFALPSHNRSKLRPIIRLTSHKPGLVEKEQNEFHTIHSFSSQESTISFISFRPNRHSRTMTMHHVDTTDQLGLMYYAQLRFRKVLGAIGAIALGDSGEALVVRYMWAERRWIIFPMEGGDVIASACRRRQRKPRETTLAIGRRIYIMREDIRNGNVTVLDGNKDRIIIDKDLALQEEDHEDTRRSLLDLQREKRLTEIMHACRDTNNLHDQSFKSPQHFAQSSAGNVVGTLWRRDGRGSEFAAEFTYNLPPLLPALCMWMCAA